MKSARAYNMTARRDTVEQTRERILQAAYDTWIRLPYDHVTLDAVARDAGTTRQTVLRHFGSKDELAVAVVDWQLPREESARRVEPGDIVAAVRQLVERYEEMGDANVRMLELEGRIAPIDHLLGRRPRGPPDVDRDHVRPVPARPGRTTRTAGHDAVRGHRRHGLEAAATRPRPVAGRDRSHHPQPGGGRHADAAPTREDQP